MTAPDAAAPAPERGRKGRFAHNAPAMGAAAISITGLRKSYGRHEAVRGIDLEVAPGEIFAFLGPNGAGKTTTVEILEGYRSRSAGEVSVLGADPEGAGDDWRGRVGIVLQECRMEPKLTVRETLEMYAGYYPAPREVEATIDLVGLAGEAHQRAGRLSGGQQRRLDVAVALIGDAELLFLDEPTTGFDPSARRHFWDVISGLRDLGKTVFLTTHYMDEAQALADRVAVIRSGEIVAAGTPDDLGGRGEAASLISFVLPPSVAADSLPDLVRDAAGATPNGTIALRTTEPVRVLGALTGWALERDVDLQALEVRRPSLEDVYLELTSEEEQG
jgi:ABC-2 type transport system ATP-binding protein